MSDLPPPNVGPNPDDDSVGQPTQWGLPSEPGSGAESSPPPSRPTPPPPPATVVGGFGPPTTPTPSPSPAPLPTAPYGAYQAQPGGNRVGPDPTATPGGGGSRKGLIIAAII